MARVMMWVSQEFQGTTTATINIRHPHETNALAHHGPLSAAGILT